MHSRPAPARIARRFLVSSIRLEAQNGFRLVTASPARVIAANRKERFALKVEKMRNFIRKTVHISCQHPVISTYI